MIESTRFLEDKMKCPRCASTRVYPSRLRGTVERVRQKITDRQPYRCHECGWRAWRDVEFLSTKDSDVTPDDLRTGRRPSALDQKDVDQLDPAS